MSAKARNNGDEATAMFHKEHFRKMRDTEGLLDSTRAREWFEAGYNEARNTRRN